MPLVVSGPAAGAKSYPLVVQYGPGVSASQHQIIERAADRWRQAIVAPVPAYPVNGVPIEGIIVSVRAAPLAPGVEGKTVNQYRPQSCGSFPVEAEIVFDSATLAKQEADGSLLHIAEHELGHALGFGMELWTWNGLVTRTGDDVRYTGPDGMAEYGRLIGAGPTPVPAEELLAGSGLFHWRETTFGDELMSTYEPNVAMSRVSLASLSDLGYAVDLGAADAYQLSRSANFLLRLLPFKKAQTSHDEKWDRAPGIVLPELPPL